MQAGAPDSISYLPTILMNRQALIKLTMPLSLPAADTQEEDCVYLLCGTTPRDRQPCVRILIAFFIDYSSSICKKKERKKNHCKQLFAD